MRIKVLCSINNGQYNIGDVKDFPEKEAKALIKVGAAKLLVVPKVIEKVKEVIKKASPTTKADTNMKGKGQSAKRGR